MVKKGYYGNDGLSLAWDLGIIFLCIPNYAVRKFSKKSFFNLGLKDVIEKCAGCFLVYLFLRGFLIKNM